MIRLTIEHNGHVFEPPIKDEVVIEWERTGSAGKLTFTTVKIGSGTSTNMAFQEGDKVTFYHDDKVMFVGYVFTKKRDRQHHIEVTCYDQIRYLKNKFSYVFTKKTATQIVQSLCSDFKLQTGTLDDSKYAIPTIAEENKEALDIILTAAEETLSNTGDMFVLFDEGGKIQFRDCSKMVLDTLITDDTAENFDYSTSIDKETYNSVVLYYKPQS